MLSNVHSFNRPMKQGLEVIYLNAYYPVVDLMLENFHLVIELFQNEIVCHPKQSMQQWFQKHN